MSRRMRSWSASSVSSTGARTGRPRSATTRAIRRRTDEPFVRPLSETAISISGAWTISLVPCVG